MLIFLAQSFQRPRVMLSRKHCVYGMLALGFGLMGLRMVGLLQGSFIGSDDFAASTHAYQSKVFDRRGIVLATNVKTHSVYINPLWIRDAQKVENFLHKLFPSIPRETLQKRIHSFKGFIWIQRHITPQKQRQILEKGLPGICLVPDQKRWYPYGRLFSHVLGMSHVDQQKLAGLEKLSFGRDIRTSLDVRFQSVMYHHLQQAIEKFQARGGHGILMDTRSGEILAMVSLPDYDPHYYRRDDGDFNRNTQGLYEFGSLLKIHNAAMMLEWKKQIWSAVYDASKPLRIGRFCIRDYVQLGREVSFQDAFVRSSNIVHAKMAKEAGHEKQQSFFQHMGLLRPLSLDYGASACPTHPARWGSTSTMTLSYGYGLGITPLHMVQSVAALTTGFLRPIRFLHGRAATERAAVSQDTAQKICQLMAMTARGSRYRHHTQYTVGGKTGTANIPVNGEYQKKRNLTSFVGVYPCMQPKYVILVSIDSPEKSLVSSGHVTGGWVAAPVAMQILQNILPLLGESPKLHQS